MQNTPRLRRALAQVKAPFDIDSLQYRLIACARGNASLFVGAKLATYFVASQ
jgi:hypothetical protein